MSQTQTLNGRAGAAPAASTAGNVLLLSGLVVVAFSAFMLVGLGGWSYYTTPIGVRGYTSAHRLLRPAGLIGHLCGIAGFLMMLVPVAYSVRKKVRRLREVGSMKTWLDLHIFAGVVGPVLVTFHTSFKFNGIVSVAYWSMVAVVLSGFAGRYLFVRIPRTIRGLELTQTELDARTRQLGAELADAGLPEAVLAEIDAFEARVAPEGENPSYVALFLGERRMRREIRRFRQAMDRQGIARDLHHTVVDVAAERATLVRRMAYLKKTRALFDVWHVFHMPLVYIMFAIVVLHVVVTVYMGYVPFVE